MCKKYQNLVEKSGKWFVIKCQAISFLMFFSELNYLLYFLYNAVMKCYSRDGSYCIRMSIETQILASETQILTFKTQIQDPKIQILACKTLIQDLNTQILASKNQIMALILVS